MLFEEGNGAFPCQLGRVLVVPRRRVVMKAVLRARVHMHLVRHATGLERRLVPWPHGVDAFVVLGELDEHRGANFRDLVGGGRRAVEGYTGLQIAAESGCQKVGRATSPAKSGDTELTIRQLV